MKSVILAGLIALTPGFAFSQDSASATKGSAVQSKPDLQFIDKMSMHHEDGQKMAKMAAEKGSSKEVKAMGQKIAKDQAKETDQLKKWRDRWFASAPNAAGEMPKMEMSKLENSSGHEFDMAFMDMMTKHHQDGIKMANEMSGQLKQKDLKTFAKNTAQKQKSEVMKMEKWKASMDHSNHHGSH